MEVILLSGPHLRTSANGFDEKRPLHVMQLSVICVQQSINMKEKWATKTQSTIIPEDMLLLW